MAPSAFTSAAAVLLAAAPAVQAMGSFSVKNGCDKSIKLSVTKGAEMPETLGEVQPGQTSDKYPYSTLDPGFGVNFAICPSDHELSKSMLFEYSIHGGRIWYDLSNIIVSDAFPELFQNGGVSIVPSTPHTDACNAVVCPPGEAKCKDAYWKWNDDWAVHNCDQEQDTVLETCSGSGSDDSSTPDSTGADSGSSDQGSSGGGYSPPPPAPASGSDDDSKLAEMHGNAVGVPSESKDQGGAATTVVVPAVETKWVQADSKLRRRHYHGHNHHHA